MNTEEKKKDIAHFVEENFSGFDLDDYVENIDFEEEPLLFSTRENGDVGAEKYGEEDYRKAVSLKKELLKSFKGVAVEIDTCDEWVSVTVSLAKETKKENKEA